MTCTQQLLALEKEIEDLQDEIDYMRGERDMLLHDLDELDDLVAELQVQLDFYRRRGHELVG